MAEAAAKKREKQAKKEVSANRRAANRLLSPEEVASAKRKLRNRTATVMQILPILTAIGFGITVFTTAPGEMNVPKLLPVQRKSWDAVGLSIRALAESRQLLVLTDVPIYERFLSVQNKRQRVWTPQLLADSLPPTVQVYRQSTPAFATFHDDKPLQSAVKIQWSDFNTMHSVPPLTVMGLNTTETKRIGTARDTLSSGGGKSVPFSSVEEAIRAGDGNGDSEITSDDATDYYYYFSQNIATLPQPLQKDAAPFKELALDEAAQMNVWMGRSGVVTHSHYDSMYNLFFQLHGRKRFTLFPPTHTKGFGHLSSLRQTLAGGNRNGPHLCLYPCLHPHYGHLQSAPSTRVNPIYPNQPQIDTSADPGPIGWEVDLGPGDLLVVPPFYFHHVLTLEPSISVNVWSDAPEYVTIEQIYSAPLPFESDWPLSKKVLATASYLSAVVETLTAGDAACQKRVRIANVAANTPNAPVVCVDDDYAIDFTAVDRIKACGDCTDDFVARWLLPRYAPLVTTGDLKVDGKVLNQYRHTYCRHAQNKIRSLSIEMFGASFERGLKKIIPLFRRLSSTPSLNDDSLSVRSILLANYFEHVANTMLSAPAVYPFISSCFRPTSTNSDETKPAAPAA